VALKSCDSIGDWLKPDYSDVTSYHLRQTTRGQSLSYAVHFSHSILCHSIFSKSSDRCRKLFTIWVEGNDLWPAIQWRHKVFGEGVRFVAWLHFCYPPATCKPQAAQFWLGAHFAGSGHPGSYRECPPIDLLKLVLILHYCCIVSYSQEAAARRSSPRGLHSSFVGCSLNFYERQYWKRQGFELLI